MIMSKFDYCSIFCFDQIILIKSLPNYKLSFLNKNICPRPFLFFFSSCYLLKICPKLNEAILWLDLKNRLLKPKVMSFPGHGQWNWKDKLKKHPLKSIIIRLMISCSSPNLNPSNFSESLNFFSPFNEKKLKMNTQSQPLTSQRPKIQKWKVQKPRLCTPKWWWRVKRAFKNAWGPRTASIQEKEVCSKYKARLTAAVKRHLKYSWMKRFRGSFSFKTGFRASQRLMQKLWRDPICTRT